MKNLIYEKVGLDLIMFARIFFVVCFFTVILTIFLVNNSTTQAQPCAVGTACKVVDCGHTIGGDACGYFTIGITHACIGSCLDYCENADVSRSCSTVMYTSSCDSSTCSKSCNNSSGTFYNATAPCWGQGTCNCVFVPTAGCTANGAL